MRVAHEGWPWGDGAEEQDERSAHARYHQHVALTYAESKRNERKTCMNSKHARSGSRCAQQQKPATAGKATSVGALAGHITHVLRLPKLKPQQLL